MTLLVSDLYYPGWKVKVNGRDERVIKVFGLLKGVTVEKGRSKVLFSSCPLSFNTGTVISAITFIGWAALLVISKRRKRATHDRTCRLSEAIKEDRKGCHDSRV
jgi:uncharacterized membrane protein YfhO